MKEIAELRTAHAKHFLLPDGRRQAVITAAPQHYLDRDTGRWEDVDPRAEGDITVPGFELNLKRMPYRTRFGASGYRFGFGIGQYVTWRFVGAKATKPAVDGAEVVYAGLWPSTDLVLTPLASGVKEEIVLRDASAPAEYRFALAETGAVEVRAEEGGLVYLAGDKVLGKTPPPTARDASGQAGQVSLSFADGVLTLSLDPAWLAQAAFPVTIDPTVTLQPDPTAGKDAWVNSYYPDDNYGNRDYLCAGTSDLSTKDRRGLIQFDLSSVPVGAGIVSADLRLYCYYEGETADYYVGVHDVLSDWNEATVTWNNQPSHNPSYEARVLITAPGAWYSWNLLGLTKAWHQGTRSNRGVKLVNEREDIANTDKLFYSSDYVTDPALRPKLVITYTLPSVSITSPSGTQSSPTVFQNDVTPDLVGVYNSADSVNMAYRQHQVLDELGNVAWDSGKVADAKPSGSTVTVTVPLGYLRYGRRYRWRWMAWDANGGYSAWSSYGWFICSLASVSPTDIAASDHLYAITPSGRVVALEEANDDLGTAIPWRVIYPVPMPEPGIDVVLEGVWVIAEVPTGSTFGVQYSLLPTGDTDWSSSYAITPGAGVQVLEIAFPIAGGAEYRSPFARLKLSGTGPFYLYAIEPMWREARR